MNDQLFFDLAMKVIGHQADDAERAKLEALLAREPELRAEFKRLESDARLAKDALPLVTACIESTGEFPDYARGLLQTVVRQTLGRPESPSKEQAPLLGLTPAHSTRRFMPRTTEETSAPYDMRGAARQRQKLTWGWVVGLTAVTAVVFVALTVFRTSNEPMIQLAVLDTMGGTRGTGTNELATLQETWRGNPLQTFSNASELEAWEQKWPNGYGRPAAKIIYDPAAGEIRVSGYSKGKAFKKTFPLEKDLATTLQQAKTFVREQIKK